MNNKKLYFPESITSINRGMRLSMGGVIIGALLILYEINITSTSKFFYGISGIGLIIISLLYVLYKQRRRKAYVTPGILEYILYIPIWIIYVGVITFLFSGELESLLDSPLLLVGPIIVSIIFVKYFLAGLHKNISKKSWKIFFYYFFLCLFFIGLFYMSYIFIKLFARLAVES